MLTSGGWKLPWPNPVARKERLHFISFSAGMTIASDAASNTTARSIARPALSSLFESSKDRR
jgi:hypothetical protein